MNTKQTVKRRRPSQDRARKTQLLIFESATKLLEQEGLEHFNTNRLAEVSGYSVGTIYQYFPDKRAILLALAHHEQDRAMQEVRRLLFTDFANLPGDEGYPRVRAIVRAISHTYGSRQRAHKILIDLALQAGGREQLDKPMLTLTALLSSGAVLSETDAFVLTQAVIGSIRAALVRDARMVKRAAFEDALVDLITGFIKARRVSQSVGTGAATETAR